jgi:hypothetical protein
MFTCSVTGEEHQNMLLVSIHKGGIDPQQGVHNPAEGEPVMGCIHCGLTVNPTSQIERLIQEKKEEGFTVIPRIGFAFYENFSQRRVRPVSAEELRAGLDQLFFFQKTGT